MRLPAIFAMFVLLMLATAPASAKEHPGFDNLRLNQIQIIGSHNSYKLLLEPELFKIISIGSSRGPDIDYQHMPMTDQLQLGLRNLEIDICYDPDGGRYADPLGHKLIRAAGGVPIPHDPRGELATPGFKIMHQPDFDFRSSVYAFEKALEHFAIWSDAHPGHLPVIVTMNCKQRKEKSLGAGTVEPGRFDGDTFDKLDAVLRERLGNRLLVPDDIRGELPSVSAAIKTRGWPAIKDVRGRFIFVLDEGTVVRDVYLSERGPAARRCMFTLSDPASPEAAIFIVNDPKNDQERIAKLVKAGFIVRTRADAETKEARTGDTSRFEAAMSSGAQVITTDYYIPDLRRNVGYVVRFMDHDHGRSSGPYARANPSNPPAIAPAE